MSRQHAPPLSRVAPPGRTAAAVALGLGFAALAVGVGLSSYGTARLAEAREQAEADRAARTAAAGNLTAAAGGLVLAGLAGGLLVRRRTAPAPEAPLHGQGDLIRAALVAIGEGAIVTDAAGRVVFLNPVARELTGWGEDALGRPLDVVLRIVREADGRPVESAFSQVMASGKTVVQAGHRLLVARDGTRVPIDESGAPIRGEGRVLGVVVVCRDVRQQRQAEERLKRHSAELAETLALLDTFVAHAPVGLAFLDRELRYLRVNKSLAAMNGRPARSHLTRPLREVVPNLADELEPLLRHVLETSQPILNRELTGERPGAPGQRAHWLSSYYPVQTSRGTVLGVGVMVEDVTERKRAEERLRASQEALQEADRRKDEFLAMLGHELRNPLAPIRNAVHVLRLFGPADEQQRWARDVIQRQAEQLSRLVDDLLDVSRITGGKIQLVKERVEITVVVARAVETSRPLIDARRHDLRVTLPTESLPVEADVTRLAQVLVNLLNNAAKYTEPGGRIGLAIERAGGDVVVRVRDTGVGIPPEALPRVFDLFTQAQRTLDSAQGGLGIGLSLVKRLVELHGGSVEAHSEGPGKGSEFTVRLPLLGGAGCGVGNEQPGRTAHPAPRARQPRRVLVVDDNRDAAETLALLLRSAGHEVCLAYDGVEALAAAEGFGPEVAFLDIGLPGLDGYEVARRLRQRPGKLLLVAVTGYGQEEDRRRAHAAGFDRHLVKPVDPTVLQELLAA
jgi:PAS domain S-box-containing protein